MNRRQFLMGAAVASPALLFLGSRDSIAINGDSIFAAAPWQSYFPGSTIHNFAVAGDRTDQMIVRMPKLIVQKPKIMLLMGGLNDTEHSYRASRTVRNLMTMCWMARLSGITPIVCTTLHVSKERAGREEILNGRIAKINEKLAEWCNTFSIQLIDINNLQVGQLGAMSPNGRLNESFARDGAHPNALGYENLGAVIKRGLTL